MSSRIVCTWYFFCWLVVGWLVVLGGTGLEHGWCFGRWRGLAAIAAQGNPCQVESLDKSLAAFLGAAVGGLPCAAFKKAESFAERGGIIKRGPLEERAPSGMADIERNCVELWNGAGLAPFCNGTHKAGAEMPVLWVLGCRPNANLDGSGFFPSIRGDGRKLDRLGTGKIRWRESHTAKAVLASCVWCQEPEPANMKAKGGKNTLACRFVGFAIHVDMAAVFSRSAKTGNNAASGFGQVGSNAETDFVLSASVASDIPKFGAAVSCAGWMQGGCFKLAAASVEGQAVAKSVAFGLLLLLGG